MNRDKDHTLEEAAVDPEDFRDLRRVLMKLCRIWN